MMSALALIREMLMGLGLSAAPDAGLPTRARTGVASENTKVGCGLPARIGAFCLLSVKDGRLLLPDGTSYRVMLLRDSDRMTPAVARKIGELVAAGAYALVLR